MAPKFNKKLPKNAIQFFSPLADLEYKAKHPIGYRVLLIVGLTALFLPIVLYIVLNFVVFQAPNSGWLLLGFVGAFIIGIGLFNIVGAWIEQYLGHTVTIVCFLLGGILVAASEMLLFNQTLYSFFDEDIVSYYFISLALLLVPIFAYGKFRCAVYDWIVLKSDLGKSRTEVHFRRLTKGKRNFWWYEAVNREFPLEKLYIVNKVYTVLYPLTFIFTLLTGLFRIFSPLIGVLSALVYLCSAFMNGFANIQMHKAEYGHAFVLLDRDSWGHWDSVLFDLVELGIILLIAYCHISMTFELWGFSFPLRIFS